MVKKILYFWMRGLSLLLFVVIFAFILLMFSPIDPIQSYVGAGTAISPEQKENIAEYWGLNDPPLERLITWATHLLQGDLGVSMIYRQDVIEVIQNKFLLSVSLMLVAWILGGFFGVLFGLIMGIYRSRWIDRILKSICYTLTAIPSYYLGTLLLMIFAVFLQWFPIGLAGPIGIPENEVTFGQRIWHMILPALCLSVISIPTIALHTRTKLLEALDSDYADYARARGESEYTIVTRQCLRNVLLPATMIQFAMFSELFGGSVLVEQVFSYPGLGQATVTAGLSGDMPLLLGITIFSAIFVFIGNAIGDLVMCRIDPRIWKRRSAR